MTISNTTVEQLFSGNGSTTAFAIPFAFQANSEIEVTLRDETDPEAPVITPQVLTTHYTLTGGPPVTTVTMNTAPTSAQKLLIRRVTAKTQTADYIPSGPFPADTHEATLDKIVQQTQELSNALDRVFKFNKTKNVSPIDREFPEPVISGVWAWNSTADAVEFIDPTTLLGVLGGFADPMTTRGDIIIRDASNNTDRLPVGASGEVLTSDGSDISWQPLPSSITAIAALGSVPNANGMTLTTGTLNLEPADTSFPGVVTTTTQSFAGAKTFTGALIAAAAFSAQLSSADNTTTGSAADMALPTNTGVRLINSSLVSVRNIAAGANGRVLVVMNDTTNPIDIVNDSGGTAANRIITGTGSDLTLAVGASLLLYYDSQNSRWRVIGGSGSGGGGAGDVVGPASSTDNAIARFDSTTGKLLQNSGVTISDTDDIATTGEISADGDITCVSGFFIGDGSMLSNLPTGFADPMTTRGDLIYRNASNATARLPIGGSGTVLTSDGTDVSWQTPASGFADPMTTRGDIIYRNASNATTRLARGASGTFLRSDGTDLAYAAVTLTTDVTGVLPLANGGTAKNMTAVAGGLVWTDADSMEVSAAGTAGQIATSNGTSAPDFQWGARPQVFGSRATPRSVVAATGITSGASHMSTTAIQQMIYVEGSTGAESVCATITAGTIVGQRMTLVGRNDSQMLTIDDTTTNVVVNGSAILGANSIIEFLFDGTNWVESSRSVK